MRTWYSGLDNYRKHTIEFGPTNTFTTELLDVPLKFNTVNDAFNAHLNGVPLPVEVLYSGGLDSECVLLHCLRNKIPVVAVTMKLMLLGRPINVHDLYYAEKFCRENQVEHRIVELDIGTFFNNGDHIPLMEPYRFTMFSAVTKLWLLKQCESFPVIGGDYSWPQINIGKKIYSPHRYDYSAMELFMADNGITGIGNMISNSLDSNRFFIQEHVKVQKTLEKNADLGWIGSSVSKTAVLAGLGFSLELRHRSYGWELISAIKDFVDFDGITADLIKRHGETTSIVKWGNTLAELVDGIPGLNDDYGI